MRYDITDFSIGQFRQLLENINKRDNPTIQESPQLKELREARAEIETLKADLYLAIQALHWGAPCETMPLEEIRAWLKIRNTLSDKYKGET